MAGVTVNLGAGTASGGDAQVDVVTKFLNLIGGQGNDTLTGDGQANTIIGGRAGSSAWRTCAPATWL